MNWPVILVKFLNIIISALAVGLSTYAASQSVEGSIVAGLGGVVNHLRENPITAKITPPPTGGVPLLKLFAILTFFTLAFPIMGNALTLDWNRNTESDMAAYQVYGCWTAACVLKKDNTMKISGALVPQTAVGVRPSWPIPAGRIGFLGVTAIDRAGNESLLSVPLAIDSVAPATPSDVKIFEPPLVVPTP